MKRFFLITIGFAATLSLLWIGAKHEVASEAAPSVNPDASAVAKGAAAFIGADFSGLSMKTLESHALPWKLVTAALTLEAIRQEPSLPPTLTTTSKTLASFGFLPRAQVINLPEGVATPPGALPLGFTYGTIEPIAGAPLLVANLGCAACHAGVSYSAEGLPISEQAWIGMPNSSLNLEAYTQAVFDALRAQENPDVLLDMVQKLYPETGWRERQVMRWLVLPMVRNRLDETADDRPLPFPNGVPGSTNGVAALKHVFNVPLIGSGAGDAGIVSIPDLGYRHWRTSLLADGVYVIPGAALGEVVTAEGNTSEKRKALAAITTFFTVPSMGVHPKDALSAQTDAENIFEFLSETYEAQPFPGQVNAESEAKGRGIYNAQCSACHGHYENVAGREVLQSFPNWQGNVGTDTLRAEVFSEDLALRVEETPYRDLIAVNPGQGYVAPPLSGLWASAPYLHNGSVPTLWALLTPEERPIAFEIGGHALDFENVGILLEEGRFPQSYEPFSMPVLFDTGLPGQGNQGHGFGADLSPSEKMALIEYLKRL